jgi:hypothetical protein
MFERRYFVVGLNFHGAILLSKLLNDHLGAPYREQALHLSGGSL